MKNADKIIQWYPKLKESENNVKNSNFYKLIKPIELRVNVIKVKQGINIDKINNNDILGLTKTFKKPLVLFDNLRFNLTQEKVLSLEKSISHNFTKHHNIQIALYKS